VETAKNQTLQTKQNGIKNFVFEFVKIFVLKFFVNTDSNFSLQFSLKETNYF
jgi:hypothetical protein